MWGLEAKRKEVRALLSICAAKPAQKRPALAGYGQNHLFRRQKTMTYGHRPVAFFLKLCDFDSYLNLNPEG